MDNQSTKNPAETSVSVPNEEKQRKQRNLAIALGLGAFMLIVFLVTILRIGGAVADRPF